MTNPTSNFGWQMPTSTDLVTDLPADFEVFGQAVDTSMADLKGGTSGQVLSKNSNTDMDFVWVTSDDANAIQNAIVDAKGDLITATAADTPARLAVGTNGQTLVADSSTATGLKWATASAGGLVPIVTTDSGGAVSTFSINDVFSSSYRNYKVLVNYTASTVAQLTMRLRVSGTDNTTASSYLYQLINPSGSTVYASEASANTGYVGIYSGTLKSALELNFYNPNLATPTNYQSIGWGGSDVDVRYANGLHNQSTAYTGFTLLNDGGTITIDKLTVYGFKEA